MKAEPLIKEVTIDAPPSKVWRAITNKDEMKHWYFDLEEFRPEVGFEFQFTGGTEEHTYLHLCKITDVVENKKLTYSWRYEGDPGISYVTFELFPEGTSTRVKLTHEGLETFSAENPDFRRENFVMGWNEIIGTSLKNYAEQPDTYIEKSMKINASTSRVWEVLTNLDMVKEWASGYSEGAYAESDWKIGSTVVWKDKGGDVGAKGVVTANEPEKLLKVEFYDDVNAEPPAKPGAYSETYSIREHEGHTHLSTSSGPLKEKDAAMHSPLWDKAVLLIKELAEKRQ